GRSPGWAECGELLGSARAQAPEPCRREGGPRRQAPRGVRQGDGRQLHGAGEGGRRPGGKLLQICVQAQPGQEQDQQEYFRKMLQKELNHMLTDTGNRKAADKLIQNLDANHDGRISFDEYWTLIGGITSPIANLIRQQEQQSSS
uniref:S100 calcium binding protein A16 n=1 Tax=Sus scrofa TaxID=9823 RepID=A0A8D0N5I5_PIG